jgi:putative membrane protein
MGSSVPQLLTRWLVLALGVTLATKVPGIECDDAGTLLCVVVLLSLFNAVLKPVLLIFTLPFILVTMGLGVIVINALLLMLVGHLVHGFVVGGFWPAVWGALVISATNLFLSGLLRRRPPPPPPAPGPGRGPGRGDRHLSVGPGPDCV